MSWICSYCNLVNTNEWCKLCERVPIQIWNKYNSILLKKPKKIKTDPQTLKSLEYWIKKQKENTGRYGTPYPNFGEDK